MKEDNAEVLVRSLFETLGASPEQVKKIFNNEPLSAKLEGEKVNNSSPAPLNPVAPGMGMGTGYGSINSVNPTMNAYGTQATNMHMRGGPTSVQNIIQAQNMSELADASLMRFRAMNQQQPQGQSASKPAFTDEMFKSVNKNSEDKPAFTDDMFSKNNLNKEISSENLQEIYFGKAASQKTEASVPTKNGPALTPPTPFESFLDNMKKLMPGTGSVNSIKEKLENMGIDFSASTLDIMDSAAKAFGLDKLSIVSDYLKEEKQKENSQKEYLAVANPQVKAPSVETPNPVKDSLQEAKENMKNKIESGVLNIEHTANQAEKMLEKTEKEQMEFEAQKKELYRFSMY